LEEDVMHLMAEFAKHGLHEEGRAGDRGKEGMRWSSKAGGRAGRASRREVASTADGKGDKSSELGAEATGSLGAT
jgi:hypothetical protein